MPIDYIPDSAHPPFVPLPVPPAPLPPLPRRPILKYLPLPILLITLSISIYAVSSRTSLKSNASISPCPVYYLSSAGLFTSNTPNRQIQLTVNGSPLGVFDTQNPQTITVPPEGIHTWQAIDDQKCTSSGSYTPKTNRLPNTDPQYPLLIPTLAK